MQFAISSIILMASASLVAANPFEKRQNFCLFADVMNPASALDGLNVDSTQPNQTPSNTNEFNFINFCTGSIITNGGQINSGSCNPIPMGRIPGINNMVSSIIRNPGHAADLPSFQTFDVAVAVINIETGAFTNPQATYYSAPQDLNDAGNIIGHAHITITRLGDSPEDPASQEVPSPILLSADAADAGQRGAAFFQGLNAPADGNGVMTVPVEGGLAPGFYRVCTMISAANHQPVLMPVAQRGAQDDCTKFTISDSGTPAVNVEQDLEDDMEAGIITDPNATPVGDAAQQPLARRQAPPVAAPGDGRPAEVEESTAAGDSASVEDQPELAAITQANVDVANGFGATPIRMSSGDLGGVAPFIMSSGNPATPFVVNTVQFETAQGAVARSCRLQFRSCKTMAEAGQLPNGAGLDQCKEQRRTCGAEPQDIAAARRAMRN